MKKQQQLNVTPVCKTRILALKDAMQLLSGKWKFHIIGTLMVSGKLRFLDLLREVDGIAAKMLSKELQELELNQIVTRTVRATKPITVEYELTEYGKSLENVINEIANWGIIYRKSLFDK